jgi:hypothetical protein
VGYRCEEGMDVGKWLDDMQRMYNDLVDRDSSRMSDKDFALAVFDLMPMNDRWMNTVTTMQNEARSRKKNHQPSMSSTEVITHLREIHWSHTKRSSESSGDIFSARYEAECYKRPNSPSANTAASFPNKKVRRNDSYPKCGNCNRTNPPPCFRYGSPDAGKYPPNWKGPWDLHIPEHKRLALRAKLQQQYKPPATGGPGSINHTSAGPNTMIHL